MIFQNGGYRMTIQRKPNYINPLSMMDRKQNKVQELQNKRQMLQNQMLLRKAMSAETGGMPVQEEKAMEKRLEELSSELRAEKDNMDVYTKGEEASESAGIYQVKQGIGMAQEISFAPYRGEIGNPES